MTGFEAGMVMRSLTIGGEPYRVATVDDEAALLAAAGDRAIFPFGLMLWEAAIGLGEELAARASWLRGRSVLELGAGVGLTGVVAAKLGATVTQSDHDPATLEACRKTAALNGVNGIRVIEGDWYAWSDGARYDCVLGADIAYDSADHEAILRLARRVLRPGGAVLIADPGRQNQALFLSEAHVAGWTARRTTRVVDDLKRAGVSVEVTIIELRDAGD